MKMDVDELVIVRGELVFQDRCMELLVSISGASSCLLNSL